MWTIGELARQSGLQTSAIRYYESSGLLEAPRRESGQRRYDPSALKRLKLIAAARACGFMIREIQLLLHGYPDDTPAADRWQELADDKIDEIDRQIQQLQRMRGLLLEARRCNCVSLDQCAIVLDERADSADDSQAGERGSGDVVAAASDDAATSRPPRHHQDE